MQNNVYGQSPDFINTNFAQIIPQPVVPNIGVPQRNYMVDQNPEAFAHEAGLITGRIVSSILTASSVTDYMAREYEWMLIQELTELKKRFTRYFFSVKRSNDKIVVEMYDPMGQLKRTELIVPFNKHEIHCWQLVAILDRTTDKHGTEIAQFLGKLEQVPCFFLRYLICPAEQTFRSKIEEFSDVFKTVPDTLTKPLDLVALVAIDVEPLMTDNVVSKDPSGIIVDLYTNAITEFFGIVGTAQCSYREILSKLFKHVFTDGDPGELSLPEELNTPECKEDLKRIGILEYGEDAWFTTFFSNLVLHLS